MSDPLSVPLVDPTSRWEPTRSVSVLELQAAGTAAGQFAAGEQVTLWASEHWLVLTFAPSRRQIGMWRATGRWYEADERGAMGDEVLPGLTVPPAA